MESTDREVERVLDLLRDILRERGFTQLEVQDALGWGRSYLSQLFTRRKELRVEQLLLILSVIGVDPAEFFARLYRRAAPRRRSRPPWEDRAFEPEAAAAPQISRLLRLLQHKIRRADVSQADLARRLGCSPSGLSTVLRGRRRVRVKQVLEILAAIDVSPGDFFAELAAPDEEAAEEPRAETGDEYRDPYDFGDLRTTLRALFGLLLEKEIVSLDELEAMTWPGTAADEPDDEYRDLYDFRDLRTAVRALLGLLLEKDIVSPDELEAMTWLGTAADETDDGG